MFLKKLFVNESSHALVQLIRYGFVVAVAFPIDFGLLYIFTDKLHIHYLISAVLSFSISMVINFAISIVWVFRKRTDRALWKEIVGFFLIGFVGLGLTAFIVWFCTSAIGLYYLVSKLVAVSIVFFWSFGARRFMFQHRLTDKLNTLRNRLTKTSSSTLNE